MATVTPGYTFTNDEVVTPAKLNSAATPVVANIVTADIAADAITTTQIANGAVTQEKLNAGITLVPTGAIMPFAMNSAPSGWLAANGSAVSRTTYAALFAAIGTTYGAGDGNTTFTLPDLRGYFVRGSGTNSDGTASGTFGAKEADSFKSHDHAFTYYYQSTAVSVASEKIQESNDNLRTYATGSTETGHTPASTTSPRGDTETRPKNIALLYCIKI